MARSVRHILIVAACLCGWALPASNTLGDSILNKVPGTSDPWLAGMPDGSTASSAHTSHSEAPANSPVLAAGLTLSPGTILNFEATGLVNFFGLPGGNHTPDGMVDVFWSHDTGAENGISNIYAQIDGLLGVFLGDGPPDPSGTPAGLDFSPTGNVAGGMDYATLSPLLQQTFFIGDGLGSGGAVQDVVVPAGATRLFLATLDGFGWFNNTGEFDVQVFVGAKAGGGANAPEPGTFALLGLGSLGLLGYRRLRRGGR